MHEQRSMFQIVQSECLYDVIVAGGGTAGSAAAMAAAAKGLKTLIVERNSYLGGSATGGQVTPMMCTGVAEGSSINAFVKKGMIESGYGADDGFGNDGWFNPERMKFFLEKHFVALGGEILYDTEFVDVITEGERISSIIVHHMGGFEQIGAKVFIDCTGDAQVAYKAGVDCFQGNEWNGENQAVSLRFMLGNINLLAFYRYLKAIGEPMVLEYPMMEISLSAESTNPLHGVFVSAIDMGLLQTEDIRYVQAFTVPGMEGVLAFNCPQIPGIKNTLNPRLRSNAYRIGREMIDRMHQFMKSMLPGFDRSYILSVASMLGVRESRRIRGKYVLSEKDYSNRVCFEDGIARTAYPVDIHSEEEGASLGVIEMKKGEYFEIPYSSLVTAERSNLIVGGRCISSTFIAQSSIRVQPTCRAIGEACGLAAYYSIKNKIDINQIDGKFIRQLMKDEGANL